MRFAFFRRTHVGDVQAIWRKRICEGFYVKQATIRVTVARERAIEEGGLECLARDSRFFVQG